MVLTYLISLTALLAGLVAGRNPWFHLEMLSRSLVMNLGLCVAAAFTLLMGAWNLGYFPDLVAIPFMMATYSIFAGFFFGYAWRLLRLRKRVGRILYSHRSFWVDNAPTFAAMLIMLFGLYRSSILLDMPVTGIRLTSGLSLITFGFLIWTVKVVPEFRSYGILFLDRTIPWKDMIAWKWSSENVLNIEYLHLPGDKKERVRDLLTTIPETERVRVETILKSKMDEYKEEREKMLLKKESISQPGSETT